MSRWLTIVGLSLTAAYLAFVWFVFDGRFVEILLLKPNEIGDVLAGSFGPLAILWLILGFFQQGKELQQNTKALELQAEELRSLVKQQQEMVDLTRAQVTVSDSANKREETRLRHAAKPIFELHIQQKTRSGLMARPEPAPGQCFLSLQNKGAAVTDVVLNVSSDVELESVGRIPALVHGGNEFLKLRKRSESPSDRTVIRLDFTDAMGVDGAWQFVLFKDAGDSYTGEIESRPIAHEED